MPPISPVALFALIVLIVLPPLGGCSESTTSTDAATDGATDADADASGMCDEASRTFGEFLSANRSCDGAADCQIIGDCGPNADFTAIRRDAADEGYRLMAMRCLGTYDGPTYRAVCEGGVCTAERDSSYCGMPAMDSGVGDGGVDAGADAAVDASVDAD